MDTGKAVRTGVDYSSVRTIVSLPVPRIYGVPGTRYQVPAILDLQQYTYK